MNAPLSLTLPPSAQGHWVQLPSEAVAKLAAVELLNTSTLPEAWRDCLVNAREGVVDRLKVWIDLSSLTLLQQQREDQAWRQAALEYLVARRAPYSLLHSLFKVTRQDVSRVRLALQADLPVTKPKAIPSAQLNTIYAAWREVCAFHDSEASRWIALSERCPEHGLGSLYTAIVDKD